VVAPADPRNTARMHEPWSDVGIAGFALIAFGVTLAMVD
jgi:hypothetical protein